MRWIPWLCMIRRILLLLLLCLLSFCRGNSDPGTRETNHCSGLSARQYTLASEGAFYFWKVQGELPQGSDLKPYGVKRLYVRYFDVVDGPDGPRPVGIRKSVDTDAHVIPVVYVTVASLKDLDRAGIDALASNIWSLVQKLGPPESEIQLDCDWTPTTRLAYFSLLESIKRLAIKNGQPELSISSTIRLHQLKYFRSTGVPPVDRGALMIYNMGDLADPAESNSIFRADLALRYLDGDWTGEYPLPLDLALPDFHWAVTFVHGSFHALIHDIDSENLKGLPVTRRRDRYLFQESVVLDGRRLPRGTEMRLERADPCQRLQVLEVLAARLGTHQERRLIVFDFQYQSDTEKKDLIDLFRISGASCSHASCSD